MARSNSDEPPVREFNDEPEGDGGSAGLKHTVHSHSNKCQSGVFFEGEVLFVL